MLWLIFVSRFNYSFPLIYAHYHTSSYTKKQRKIKMEPRIKLNHDIYIKKRTAFAIRITSGIALMTFFILYNKHCCCCCGADIYRRMDKRAKCLETLNYILTFSWFYGEVLTKDKEVFFMQKLLHPPLPTNPTSRVFNSSVK